MLKLKIVVGVVVVFGNIIVLLLLLKSCLLELSADLC